MSEKRCKHLIYQQQIEHLKMTVDEVIAVLEAHKTVSFYELIIHDKDRNDDGSLKAPHIHLYINFGTSSATPSTVAKWFKEENSGPVSYIKGLGVKARQYLVHLNDPEKYQYDPSEVRCSSGHSYTEWLKESAAYADKTSVLNKVVEDYCNEKVTYAQAVEVLYKNKTPDSAWDKAYKKLETRRKLELKMSAKGIRDMQVIIIYGQSGVGKSTYAEIIAETLIKSGQCRDYTRSSSDNDVLQDYMGEDILIMDDFRDANEDGLSTMTFTDVLKFFDPHFMSSTKSRFQNKPFTGRLIIITTTKDPRVWYQDTAEQRWQFFRRISACYEVTRDEIREYCNPVHGENCGFLRGCNNSITFAPVSQIQKNEVQKYISLKAKKREKTTNLMGQAASYINELVEAAKTETP